MIKRERFEFNVVVEVGECFLCELTHEWDVSEIKVVGTSAKEFEDEFPSNTCERCFRLHEGVVTFGIGVTVGGFNPGGEGVGNELTKHFRKVVFGGGEGEAILSFRVKVGEMDLMWGFRFDIFILFTDWLGALF